MGQQYLNEEEITSTAAAFWRQLRAATTTGMEAQAVFQMVGILMSLDQAREQERGPR